MTRKKNTFISLLILYYFWAISQSYVNDNSKEDQERVKEKQGILWF